MDLSDFELHKVSQKVKGFKGIEYTITRWFCEDCLGWNGKEKQKKCIIHKRS